MRTEQEKKREMWNKRVLTSASSFFRAVVVVLVLILGENISTTTAQWKEQSLGLGPLVKKNQRTTIFSTEYGDVSEAVVTDGNEPFQLHFITLEPNSLFLPVLLHYDMVFYVQTGSGKLSYLDEDEKEQRELKQGDVHRLRSGAVFFIQSDLENERQKLRVIAIFDNPEYGFNEPSSGPYSSVSDLVLGFDERVLRSIFKAPEPLIEEIRNGTRPGAIIHGLQKGKKKKNTNMLRETEYENEFMEEMYNILELSNKHKKSKLFNLNDKDPDFKNDRGWSTVVDKKKYAPFRGSKYGVLMVYLTEGSMMGPHWNPMAAEVVVPVKGKGMIHVVCPRKMDVSKCNDTRFFLEEGDLLVVPRFHAMAQMAFNNETFVFMGFTTSTKGNHPQYLAGKASVQVTLDKHIMAASLGINVSTYEKLLDKQDKSVILGCTSCAEEEWMRLMKEIEEKRREEEKAEEEARKREEEKRREEEEARKKEEEEAKRREEEAQRKREEVAAQKKREEEERERQEKQRREEEEERKRREQKQKQEEERERQEQQREQEEMERQEQQRRQEEEERKQRERQQQEEEEEEEEERERQEQQQKQEQEERERKEQQREQEEWEAREREREQEQAAEAERERETQAEREEEAAREREEGQGQWGEGQEESEEEWQEQQQPKEREREEQEEWTYKEREHEQAQARSEEETAKAAQGQQQWREYQGEQGSNQKRARRTLSNISLI